jgi:sulfur relay (sulfurtransferase) complex TusBCD TusD component (DsrE family)
MAKYVLIESRDPFESRDVANWCQLAADLRKQGNEVTLFLVQNAVLGARAGARWKDLAAILKTDVEVLADDFSLRERGIAPDRLAAGVRCAPLDVLVDRLADGCRTVWH